MQGRQLTYDEKNAAEAAFFCRPFNAEWSANARIIYRGIIEAMWDRCIDCEFELAAPRQHSDSKEDGSPLLHAQVAGPS